MPEYSAEVKRVLRGTLTACRHILAETCSSMADVSNGKDLLPEMLRGSQKQSGLRHGSGDLTGFHAVLLWSGNTIAAVGEFQIQGHCALTVCASGMTQSPA